MSWVGASVLLAISLVVSVLGLLWIFLPLIEKCFSWGEAKFATICFAVASVFFILSVEAIKVTLDHLVSILMLGVALPILLIGILQLIPDRGHEFISLAGAVTEDTSLGKEPSRLGLLLVLVSFILIVLSVLVATF